MATKDWKKVKGSKDFFGFRKKKEEKAIAFRKSDKYNNWFGSILEQDKGSDFIGEFNTKSEALSFAKQYMRSH